MIFMLIKIKRSRRLRAEMNPANRECLTSQTIRGIWIVGCGCSPSKCYQRIRTCLTGEVEFPSSPIRRQAPDVKYPDKMERRPDRIPDVRHPEKVGCRRTEFRMWDIRRRWDVGEQNSECETFGEGGTSARQNFGCEISGEGGTLADRILDVRHPEKVGCRWTEFRMWDIRRRWDVGRTEFQMWDIRRRWDVGR